MVFTGTFLLAAVQVVSGSGADPCTQAIRLSMDGQRTELVRAAEELGAQRPHFFLPAASPIRLCVDSFPALRSWGVPDDQRKLYVAPLQIHAVRNSAYPKSINDGLLWAGVGTSAALTGGVEVQWRWLTIGLKPTVVWQQNKYFKTPAFQMAGVTMSLRPPGTLTSGLSRFANVNHPGVIDYPERFGDASFGSVDAGQSFIRLDAGPISAALSHENLWMGASDVFPIMLSNTAPGFWHVRFGTRTPGRLAWFNVDTHVVWGALQESDYFDGSGQNDEHLFAALAVSIEPTFVPGLKLGASRIAHLAERPGGHSLGFYLDRFIDSPAFSRVSTNLPENGLGAVFVSWTIPEGGFEVHAEWVREDRFFNFQDLLREPDWTQAYGLGFGKIFKTSTSVSRFWGELVHLGESAPVRAGKGFFSYYTHRPVTQGHTHRGQLLGAAIGPGSDVQVIGFDHFRESGLLGGYIQRTRYDDDTYYRQFSRRYGEARHDVELTGGLHATRFLGSVHLQAGVSASRRYDRSFLVLRTSGTNQQIETNWGLDLRLTWQPNLQ